MREGLHVEVTGSGPLVLFIHGFPFDSRMWLDQVQVLADAATCIAPDLAGFGRSAPVTDPVLTMDRHADDLVAMLAGMSHGPVDVVGFSMGGYVALAIADRHPGMVRSLALIDSRSTADDIAARQGRDDAIARLLTETRIELADRMLDILLAPDASSMVRQRMRTMMESTPYETIHAALAGMRDRPDRTNVLAALDVPVALIVGEHDTVTPPSDAEAMAGASTGAVLTVVEGAGHMSPMEAPNAVAAALRAHLLRSPGRGTPDRG